MMNASDSRIAQLRRRGRRPLREITPGREAIAATFAIPGLAAIIAGLALISTAVALLFAGVVLVAAGVGYLRGA